MATSGTTIPCPPPGFTRTDTQQSGRDAINRLIREGELRRGSANPSVATKNRLDRKNQRTLLYVAGAALVLSTIGGVAAWELASPDGMYQRMVVRESQDLLQQTLKTKAEDNQRIQQLTAENNNLREQPKVAIVPDNQPNDANTSAAIIKAYQDAQAKQAQQQSQPAPQQQTPTQPIQQQLRSNDNQNVNAGQREQQYPCPEPYKHYQRAWPVPAECGPGAWRQMPTPGGRVVMLPPPAYRVTPVPLGGTTIALPPFIYMHFGPHEKKPKQEKQPKQTNNSTRSNTNVQVGVEVNSNHTSFGAKIKHVPGEIVGGTIHTFRAGVHMVFHFEFLHPKRAWEETKKKPAATSQTKTSADGQWHNFQPQAQ